METEEKMEDEIAEAEKLIKRLDVKIDGGLQQIDAQDKEEVDNGFLKVRKKIGALGKKMDNMEKSINQNVDNKIEKMGNSMDTQFIATNKQMGTLENKIDARGVQINKQMGTMENKIDARINGMENKIDAHGIKIDAHGIKIDGMKGGIDMLVAQARAKNDS